MIRYLVDWFKASFSNLSWKWPNEPVLYLALAVAIINAVITGLDGSVGWPEVADTILIAIGAFAARGKVSPLTRAA